MNEATEWAGYLETVKTCVNVKGAGEEDMMEHGEGGGLGNVHEGGVIGEGVEEVERGIWERRAVAKFVESEVARAWGVRAIIKYFDVGGASNHRYAWT